MRPPGALEPVTVRVAPQKVTVGHPARCAFLAIHSIVPGLPVSKCVFVVLCCTHLAAPPATNATNATKATNRKPRLPSAARFLSRSASAGDKLQPSPSQPPPVRRRPGHKRDVAMKEIRPGWPWCWWPTQPRGGACPADGANEWERDARLSAVSDVFQWRQSLRTSDQRQKEKPMIPGIDPPSITCSSGCSAGSKPPLAGSSPRRDCSRRRKAGRRPPDSQPLQPTRTRSMTSCRSWTSRPATAVAGQFHVEMQLLPEPGFRPRVLYYWADFHRQQTPRGRSVQRPAPHVSFDLLHNFSLFPEVPDHFLKFELLNRAHGLPLVRSWYCIHWSCRSFVTAKRNCPAHWTCGYSFCGMRRPWTARAPGRVADPGDRTCNGGTDRVEPKRPGTRTLPGPGQTAARRVEPHARAYLGGHLAGAIHTYQKLLRLPQTPTKNCWYVHWRNSRSSPTGWRKELMK